MLEPDRWRPHALDGALLWFHPPTGLNLRWQDAATRALRRRAPRVVLFGITNRCNLACGFCSRDVAAPSEWTADSAYQVLAGLAGAGALEVAFGGGEPLAFPGFDALVARLATETRLAVHLTTNGVLLSPARLAALAPHVGEIRISIYDDNPWQARLAQLATAGVRAGANVLVTAPRLAGLPALLTELAAVGCRDVALLRYVGGDRTLHLAAGDDAALADLIAASPVAVRLSGCFGDRLAAVPRLGPGDCGAGDDFITLTPDRRLAACSFHRPGRALATADDVLREWRARRGALAAPAARAGCARPRPAVMASDGVRIWRGFAGNNSGDCVLVGRFATAAQASRYLDNLVPGFQPGEPFPAAWRELLAREGIDLGHDGTSPDVIARRGPVVMLHTDMSLDDDFPALRALLWKRGGRAVYTGVHEHDPVQIVSGLRFPDADALEVGELALVVDEELGDFRRRGLDLFGVTPLGWPGGAAGAIGQLAAVADRLQVPLAFELAPVDERPHLPRALATRPPAGGVERLWASFVTAETAAIVAARLDGDVAVAGRYLLLEAPAIGARVGWQIHLRGGTPELHAGGLAVFEAAYWRHDDAATPPADQLLGELRAYLGGGPTIEKSEAWVGLSVRITTPDPQAILGPLVDFAAGRGLAHRLQLVPADRLAHTVARLAADLDAGALTGDLAAATVAAEEP